MCPSVRPSVRFQRVFFGRAETRRRATYIVYTSLFLCLPVSVCQIRSKALGIVFLNFTKPKEMIINFSDDMGFMWWYCQPYYYFTTNFQAVATVSVMGLISPDIVQTWQKTTCYQNGQNNKTYNKELGPKLLT